MNPTMKPSEAVFRIFNTAVGPNEITFDPVEEAANFVSKHKLRRIRQLRTLLEDIGYLIKETDQLPEGKDGVALRKKRFPIIFIDEKLSEPEKDYTIAHELGHHILHISKYVNPMLIDVEEDMFAVALMLLTTDLYERQWYRDQVPAFRSNEHCLTVLIWETMKRSVLPKIMPTILCLAALEWLEERTKATWPEKEN